jgi:DNA-damage-inducible protein J
MIASVSHLRDNAKNQPEEPQMSQTSMLHVRVDEQLKMDAAEKLANFGLTISDAVRILLTRIAREGGLPASLTTDPDAYDAWFRAKVQEALDDPRPAVPHQQVLDEAQALIDRKRRARS